MCLIKRYCVPVRFDRKVTVPYPDQRAREQILKIHSSGLTLSPEVSLVRIAEETAGFSGADLANLLNKAAIHASKKSRTAIMQEDIDEAHKNMLQPQGTRSGTSNPLTGGSSRATVFMPNQVKCNFGMVAGMPEAKEELQDVVSFLKNPEHFKRLGAHVTRGVLLVGDPGNGKTLLARAVAGEANCPFFSVSASEFVEVFVGVGASRVRDLFAQARKHNPSIIFIDEIDAVGGHRVSGYGGQDERNQTLNQLLTEMDGFQTDQAPVIVIAATNRVDTLDKALLRAGRFDRQVHVPYPDLKSREEILRVHAQKIKLDPEVDLQKLARGTPGFTGADLANIINEAATIASKNPERTTVTIADFEEARDKILIGKESKSIMLTEEDKRAIAYHEAGHALVRLLLPEHSDPLYKLTIIPRGGALGVTHALPEREKYLHSKDEMIAQIMSIMGGRIAEELTFGVISSGASDDFNKATEIAQNMVRFWGMSEKLGHVTYSPDSNYKHSQKTYEIIDQEVRAIIEECYQKAQALLMQNRDKLEKLAQAVIEKETIMAEEAYELLGITPRTIHTIR